MSIRQPVDSMYRSRYMRTGTTPYEGINAVKRVGETFKWYK